MWNVIQCLFHKVTGLKKRLNETSSLQIEFGGTYYDSTLWNLQKIDAKNNVYIITHAIGV